MQIYMCSLRVKGGGGWERGGFRVCIENWQYHM